MRVSAYQEGTTPYIQQNRRLNSEINANRMQATATASVSRTSATQPNNASQKSRNGGMFYISPGQADNLGQPQAPIVNMMR